MQWTLIFMKLRFYLFFFFFFRLYFFFSSFFCCFMSDCSDPTEPKKCVAGNPDRRAVAPRDGRRPRTAARVDADEFPAGRGLFPGAEEHRAAGWAPAKDGRARRHRIVDRRAGGGPPSPGQRHPSAKNLGLVKFT